MKKLFLIIVIGFMALTGIVVQGEEREESGSDKVAASEDLNAKNCNPTEVDETKRIGEFSGADLGKYENEGMGTEVKPK
ncbi:MAG: hypothetical protein A2202_06590 [Bdellovibrionales bacterium RIFOXYA1_FULL_36_14]|nr:MAG: hypothetical protein A2202_06590 [Bdellovibrionales bacterium RIFOXYA1_FULL_36_14]